MDPWLAGGALALPVLPEADQDDGAVNAISGVRWVATLSPIMLLAGTFLTPVAGYEVPEFALAAVLIFLYLAAQLLRSDGLYLLSFSGLGVLLILEISPDGYFYSFAVTVAILVALDFVVAASVITVLLWIGRQKVTARLEPPPGASVRYRELPLGRIPYAGNVGLPTARMFSAHSYSIVNAAMQHNYCIAIVTRALDAARPVPAAHNPIND